MLLNQVVLVVFFDIVVRIKAVNSPNDPDYVHFLNITTTANNILQLCLRDHLNPLIITEQSSKYIFHKPMQISASSIILINDDFEIQYNVRNSNPHRGTFLLTALSDDQLDKTLSKLQTTPWWNTQSYFILIEPSSHSCVDAVKMLMIMWKKKILSAIYLCYNIDEESVMLYTFNPFINYAPLPWKWVETIQDKSDPRWILYKHQYQPGDQTICPAVMFDKTLRLDDYVLPILMNNRTLSHGLPTGVPIKLYDYRKFTAFLDISEMTQVFAQMKVKVNITGCDPMYRSRERIFYGQFREFLNHDMYLNPLPIYLGYEHITYPASILKLFFISQKGPFLNTETKILSFYHPTIIKLSVIVFVISAFVLKFNKQQEYVSAVLKMWQLYLGHYIPQTLHSNPTRIFFFGVFLLVTVLNGAFQGKLASLLTKPERIYVNSLKEALRLKYHIYGSTDFMRGAGYSELPAKQKQYTHYVRRFRCISRVLKNSQALCLTNPSFGTILAKKHGLHVSLPIHEYFSVNWVSPGFPLKHRIYQTTLNLQAIGFMVWVHRKTYLDRLDYLRAHEEDETKFRNRPIELHDLLFIFKVLIFGLVCSFMSFITEIQVY